MAADVLELDVRLWEQAGDARQRLPLVVLNHGRRLVAPQTDLWGRKLCLQWSVTPTKKHARLSTPTLMVHSTLNLVRAVLLVSRDCVPRAWVPMQLHVIECIAVFHIRGNSIQVNVAPQGEVSKLANAVDAPTMATDL